MITSEQIDMYIKKVPSLPETTRNTLLFLNKNELSMAAKNASRDPMMVHYLKNVVNSAAYGFQKEISAPAQIFSALGVQRAKELVYAYMTGSISPENWGYFSLKKDDFIHFQILLMSRWEKILEYEKGDDRYLSAAAILSAGLVVADAIFTDFKEDVSLIRQTQDLDLDTILYRVSGVHLEQIVERIAKKWEVDDDASSLVSLSFGTKECDISDPICKFAKLLHLLLFYLLSQPKMLQSGTNSFISFNPKFVMPVMESFEAIGAIE